MRCIANVEIDQGVDQSIDDILCRSRDVEALLGKAEEKMAEQSLVGLVKERVPSRLEKALNDVEDLLGEMERDILETRRMIDKVSGSCK